MSTSLLITANVSMYKKVSDYAGGRGRTDTPSRAYLFSRQADTPAMSAPAQSSCRIRSSRSQQSRHFIFTRAGLSHSIHQRCSGHLSCPLGIRTPHKSHNFMFRASSNHGGHHIRGRTVADCLGQDRVPGTGRCRRSVVLRWQMHCTRYHNRRISTRSYLMYMYVQSLIQCFVEHVLCSS